MTPLQLELLQAVTKELEVTQPTISDSLLALERKGHLVQRRSDTDRRRTTITLTDSGRELVEEVRRSGEILRTSVAALRGPDQEAVLGILLSLISELLDAGIIQVARTCLSCRFYGRHDGTDAHCALLQIPLTPATLRVDCPEHQPLLASRDPTWWPGREARPGGHNNPAGAESAGCRHSRRCLRSLHSPLGERIDDRGELHGDRLP